MSHKTQEQSSDLTDENEKIIINTKSRDPRLRTANYTITYICYIFIHIILHYISGLNHYHSK